MGSDLALEDWLDSEVFEYGENREKKQQTESKKNGNDIKKNTPEQIYENLEITKTSEEVNSKVDHKIKKITSEMILPAIKSYLKKHWIFLLGISLLWILTGSEDYLLPLFNIPFIGQPLARFALFLSSGVLGYVLRFLTATYNGPVWTLTPYTFLVAVTAKSAYVLAMTGVVFPTIRNLIKNKKDEIMKYKDIADKVKEVFKECIKGMDSLGLVLCGAGISLVLSNFLSRNGKFDKSFILILLAFVMIMGVNSEIPSVLYIIFSKIISILLFILPGGLKNTLNHYSTVRVGSSAGFLIAIVIGSLGANAGYITGVVVFIAGVFIFISQKGKSVNVAEKNMG